MLTRCAKAYSSSGTVYQLKIGVFMLSKYTKYQILYLNRITIVPCSQWWKFGNPSLHRFWLIHPWDGQTNRQTDGWTELWWLRRD